MLWTGQENSYLHVGNVVKLVASVLILKAWEKEVVARGEVRAIRGMG